MVFGKVIEGMDVVREIEDVPTTADKPNEDVTIVDCGDLPEEAQASSEKIGVEEKPETEGD